MDQNRSNQQYDSVIAGCRDEFFSKTGLYGQSWNRYRAFSLLEKIAIKLERVQKIQHVREQKVEDTISSEFPAIINYSILGMVKCAEWENSIPIGQQLPQEELGKMYDEQSSCIKAIFQKKNHDYNEAWRRLSIGFMVDEMLVKFDRAKSINQRLQNDRQKVKEFKEIFTDICNYAIFCKILIDEGVDPMI